MWNNVVKDIDIHSMLTMLLNRVQHVEHNVTPASKYESFNVKFQNWVSRERTGTRLFCQKKHQNWTYSQKHKDKLMQLTEKLIDYTDRLVPHMYILSTSSHSDV